MDYIMFSLVMITAAVCVPIYRRVAPESFGVYIAWVIFILIIATCFLTYRCNLL